MILDYPIRLLLLILLLLLLLFFLFLLLRLPRRRQILSSHVCREGEDEPRACCLLVQRLLPLQLAVLLSAHICV
jgi:hypothetical protein